MLAQDRNVASLYKEGRATGGFCIFVVSLRIELDTERSNR